MKEFGATETDTETDGSIDLPLDGSPEVTHLFWEARDHSRAGRALEAERPPWREDPRNPTPERYTPSPEMQVDVERAAAAEGGLGPETLYAVNRAAEGAGRDINCGECARAVASTLDGRPRAADALDAGNPRNSLMEGDQIVETWLGRRFTEYRAPQEARADMERDLLRAGDGAHCIVAENWTGRRGHFFNAANRGGRIVYIDAQVARQGGEALGDAYLAGALSWAWVRADRKGGS